jgi:DNA-3-methyladenine glycosylase
VSAAAAAAPTSTRLGEGFFDRSVHDVARELVGCALTFRGVGGTIVETESYADDDPACHAFNGPTPRSSVLFGPPGRAYVYFSYGIHTLLNAVSEPEGRPGAVLIRALHPLWGVERMRARRRREHLRDLCSGPGKLTESLGVELRHNGLSLAEPPFAFAERPEGWEDVEVVTTPRIGISRAAERPWRFCAAGSEYLSKPL